MEKEAVLLLPSMRSRLALPRPVYGSIILGTRREAYFCLLVSLKKSACGAASGASYGDQFALSRARACEYIAHVQPDDSRLGCRRATTECMHLSTFPALFSRHGRGCCSGCSGLGQG